MARAGLRSVAGRRHSCCERCACVRNRGDRQSCGPYDARTDTRVVAPPAGQWPRGGRGMMRVYTDHSHARGV